jgi:hypothetical protein
MRVCDLPCVRHGIRHGAFIPSDSGVHGLHLAGGGLELVRFWCVKRLESWPMRRRRRLRRLVPDQELIRRWAAGEPLRELAGDYDVAHTTLGRYFERPEVAKQVKRVAKTKRRPRLPRLVPDQELIRRRAAGEPLRELACDYDVAHTTLGRYFEQPEVAKQLRAEQRAAAARRLAKRRLEREVRRKARQQVAAEREQARRARAAARKVSSRRRPARDRYEAWLDEQEARLPLTRSDLHSRADETAARVVAAGGGSEAVIEATGLRTLENAARLIDPAIHTRAFDNDRLDEQRRRPPS